MADISKYFIDEPTRWGKKISASRSIIAKDDLADTIQEFRDFVQQYLDYFKASPEAQALPTPWLEERKKSTLLDYWMPLSMIATQYQVPEYKDRLNRITNVELKKFIDKAQSLGIIISGVLLYINKLPISYFYPYTTRSFIALSWIDEDIWGNKELMSDANLINNSKVMALPHEIGHHVYWNSDFGVNTTIKRDILNSRLTLSKDVWEKLAGEFPDTSADEQSAVQITIKNWTEEIFADVLGTLISEDPQKFADSSQNLASKFCLEPKDMLYNDGMHPIAYLRPLISAHTVDLITGIYSGKWAGFASGLKGVPKTVPLNLIGENGAQKIDVQLTILGKALELAVDDVYNSIRRGISPSDANLRISNFEELLAFAKDRYASNAHDMNNFLLTPFTFERSWVPDVGAYCSNEDKWRWFHLRCNDCGAYL